MNSSELIINYPESFLILTKTPAQFWFILKIFIAGHPTFDIKNKKHVDLVESYFRKYPKQVCLCMAKMSVENNDNIFKDYSIISYSHLSYYELNHPKSLKIKFSSIYRLYKDQRLRLSCNVVRWLKGSVK